MSNRIETKGFDDLLKKLKKLGGDKLAAKANRKAVNLGTTKILQAARENCPVDKGDLRKSQAKKVVSRGMKAQGIVGADKDYIGEDGSRPSKYDHLVEYGHNEDGKAVPPHPYLRPAWDESNGDALDKYADTLRAEIEKAAEGK